MKALIIDDERSVRGSLGNILEDEGFEVETADNGNDGLEKACSMNFDIIFCDIKMPGMDGMEVLEHLVEEGVDSAVIMISGHGDIDTAVNCLKKGAFDYIPKPPDINRILVAIRNATVRNSLTTQTKVLKKKFLTGDMVGQSPALENIRQLIAKVAPTDARVLVTGANGTGKELVARNIWQNSNRSEMPYIEVNCAAIPSELIESELFGHEKGSFTSAVRQHKGKFEQADGGTLFLDEIGDMSLSAQAKVLRVLEENKLSRVGSDKDINVDVRIIAATNKNIPEEIAAGRFREDLYHRLSVIIVKVPSLDERKSDIPLLVDHFINLICSKTAMPRLPFDKEAVDMLIQKNWPGNIRELRNVVERLLILSTNRVTVEDVKKYVF